MNNEKKWNNDPLNQIFLLSWNIIVFSWWFNMLFLTSQQIWTFLKMSHSIFIFIFMVAFKTINYFSQGEFLNYSNIGRLVRNEKGRIFVTCCIEWSCSSLFKEIYVWSIFFFIHFPENSLCQCPIFFPNSALNFVL